MSDEIVRYKGLWKKEKYGEREKKIYSSSVSSPEPRTDNTATIPVSVILEKYLRIVGVDWRYS